MFRPQASTALPRSQNKATRLTREAPIRRGSAEFRQLIAKDTATLGPSFWLCSKHLAMFRIVHC
jgi:hypothetical protein